MAREIVALVSSEDVVSAVAVHADRLHDMLRRNGLSSQDAVGIAERAVTELITALDTQPEIVVDLAGWWFGRCLSGVPGEPFGATAEQAGARSVLAGTEIEQSVRAAVAELPRLERVAIMLRDAYDLPLQAVAVALDRSTVTAGDLIANGRLHLLAAYDDSATPDLAQHVGRQPADLNALSAVAGGDSEPGTTLTQRRHVSACSVCDELLDRLGRARRLCLGLPVLAMNDADREWLIDRARWRAEDVLPTQEEVLAAAAADVEPRGVPFLAVVGLLVIAAVLGVGVGVVSRHLENSAGGIPVSQPLPPVPVESPIAARSGSPSPTPDGSQSRHTLPPLIIHTARTSAPDSSSAAPPPTTSAPSSSPPATASIALHPKRGPQGTSITVDGAGFLAHNTVSISYGGNQETTVTADGNGDFSATVTADEALPGLYDVTASDGIDSATEPFNQTT